MLGGMVGPCGLEPQASTVSRWRSNQLSYGPKLRQIVARGAREKDAPSRWLPSGCGLAGETKSLGFVLALFLPGPGLGEVVVVFESDDQLVHVAR
jgi:hypothetical protein